MNISTHKSDQKRSQALVLLIITATIWSLGGLLIKSVPWDPLAIAGSRSIFAITVMIICHRKLQFTWSPAQIGGAVTYAAMSVLFVYANKLTTAANATLLQYSAPVYVAIFGGWFLKEKTSKLDWLTIGLVLAGMGLFFFDKLSLGNIDGNICAIGSGVTYAGNVLFLRKQKEGSPLESIILGNVLMILIGGPFIFRSPQSVSAWVIIMILGLFQLGICYVLYTTAIKHVAALEAILVSVIDPILSPVWVLLFLGERPGSWAIIGGIIVLISVTGRCIIMTIKGSSARKSEIL